MKLEPVAIKYNVEVDSKKFEALLEYEDPWHGGLKASEPGLCGLLMEIGCYDVDFSGHYLNYIWFSVHTDYNCEEYQNQIIEIITEHLDKAVAWKETDNHE